MKPQTKKMLMIVGGVAAAGGAYLWYRNNQVQVANAQLAAAQAAQAMPISVDDGSNYVDPNPVVIGTPSSPPTTDTTTGPVPPPFVTVPVTSSFGPAAARVVLTGSTGLPIPTSTTGGSSSGSGSGGGGGGIPGNPATRRL